MICVRRAVRYRLYVVLCSDGSLYVGHTAKQRCVRFHEHFDRGPTAARCFRSGRVYPMRLLTKLTPPDEFTVRVQAEVAEYNLKVQLRNAGYLVA